MKNKERYSLQFEFKDEIVDIGSFDSKEAVEQYILLRGIINILSVNAVPVNELENMKPEHYYRASHEYHRAASSLRVVKE